MEHTAIAKSGQVVDATPPPRVQRGPAFEKFHSNPESFALETAKLPRLKSHAPHHDHRS
jgi:hypothetical protein